MSEDLLQYYNKELGYIRKLGAEFAKKHPKIAGRLKMGEDSIEDPHVSRLIESFAFLTARIRHKIDDSFPELTDALLGVLYPDYQAPMPSMTIVQATAKKDASEPYLLESGSEIETLHDYSDACYFKTTYDTKVWPFEIGEVKLMGMPFTSPSSPVKNSANSVLKITIKCSDPEQEIKALNPGSLRFFIKGQEQYTFKLYELLLNSCLGISIAANQTDPQPVNLKKDFLVPVGFYDDEAILPYSHRSFSGYRLLAEYFLFPEKFLFFDINGIADSFDNIGSEMEIYIYLSKTIAELEQNISADNLALNAVPVVNLFEQRAEPILLNDMVQEYRIIPNIRRPDAHEVHAVRKVTAISPDDKEYEFKPFYAAGQIDSDVEEGEGLFWHCRRESAEWSGGRIDNGTEMYLSLLDVNFNMVTPGKRWTLNIETTCTNRNRPNHLPYGAGQPALQLLEGTPEITKLQCLVAPTKARRPELKENTRWQLIAHLTLNHFSGEDGLQVLKDTLRLYDFADSAETKSLIKGVTAIETKSISTRVNAGGRIGIAQGTSVCVELDESQFVGSGLFLFASILDRFFCQFCAINSFTQFSARLKGKEKPFCKWPPRSGTQELV
ncbi:MAG: type VI secretion system baseplate subunit TssF [Gammaproteobacteria bacterium]|nr:MAG: type VI secretion system baseplate subunit TssF [Gammaproteobacteria bacterium]